VDRAGSAENPPATVTIRIDRSAPAPQIVDPTSGTAIQDGVSFAATGGDDTSGTQILWFTLREDNSDPKQRHRVLESSPSMCVVRNHRRHGGSSPRYPEMPHRVLSTFCQQEVEKLRKATQSSERRIAWSKAISEQTAR
jgi:hypothetical protein